MTYLYVVPKIKFEKCNLCLTTLVLPILHCPLFTTYISSSLLVTYAV